ncbi:MAG: hypothetical protein WC943_03605 [Elusimicrobiota bacterium]|jgi:hypothetical protein
MSLVAVLCVIVLAIAAYLYHVIRGSGGGGWDSSPLLEESPVLAAAPSRPWADGLAVLVCLGLGLLIRDVWWALGFPVHVMFHEVGHSAVAWLGGYWSLPLPFGFALNSAEPSPLVALAFASLLAWGLRTALRSRSLLLGALCAGLAAGQAFFLFFAGRQADEAWMLFGGCAGEMVVPALLISAFFRPVPGRLRWDFFRWPVMAAAAFSLAAACWHWEWSLPDPEHRIMWGEAISTTKETGHDIVRLIRQHGWTAGDAAARYALVGRLSLLLVAAVGVWSAGKPADSVGRTGVNGEP